MIRTILVPIGGSDSDEAALDVALALARLLGAHLDLVHVRINPAEAALYTRHVAFARGAAIPQVLQELRTQAETRAVAAAGRVRAFCAAEAIPIVDQPDPQLAITASWRLLDSDAMARLTLDARHHDLTIMARARHADFLPTDALERILIESGKPLVIAATRPKPHRTGTVMVCWKERPEAARALAAAMPILVLAERVVLATIDEAAAATKEQLEAMAAELRWHGIAAIVRYAAASEHETADRLDEIARAEGADLLVMGAYGHSPIREMVFGGCTRSVLAAARLPVFMAY